MHLFVVVLCLFVVIFCLFVVILHLFVVFLVVMSKVILHLLSFCVSL